MEEGGGTPRIRKFFFLSVKWTKSVTFLDQKTGTCCPKNAIVRQKFLEKMSIKGEGGGGRYPPYGHNPQSSIRHIPKVAFDFLREVCSFPCHASKGMCAGVIAVVVVGKPLTDNYFYYTHVFLLPRK